MAESSKTSKSVPLPSVRRVSSGSSARSPALPVAPAGNGASGSSSGLHVGPAVEISDAKTVISKRSVLPADLAPHPTTTSEIGQRLVGCSLGHFQLERFVGGGGMGAVFQAHDFRLDRTVAVKVLSREQSDEESQRRFENEAQSAARLDHPNVARVYHVGDEEGWSYIVFEFVEGENIRDLVARQGPLSLDQATSITLQIAEALEHASGRDVVHRDIKPSNVLVGAEGLVKLVDMGLARLHQVESSNPDLTASGVTLGTFDYISPEQARDPRSADVRSDLYSLGCTLYFMLTGQPPFPEGTVLQKLLSHSTTEVPDPRVARPELPAELSQILRQLTAKEPSRRYQAPHELIGDLLLLSQHCGLPCGARGGTVWVTPPESRLARWERHLPWLAPVAILLLVAFTSEWILPSPSPVPGVTRAAALVQSPEPAPRASAKASGDSSLESGEAAKHSPENPAARAEKSPATSRAPAAGNSTEGHSPREGEGSSSGADREPATGAAAASGTQARVPGSSDEITAAENTEPAAGTGPQLAREPAGSDPNSAKPAVGESPGVRESVADIQNLRTLVVDPTGKAPEDARTRVVTTFAEAVRTLAASPTAGEIELRFSGAHVTSPVELANRRLTIRAAAGFAPELVFRPLLGDPAEFPLAMIRQIGGELEWRGVHLRLELPREPAEGWKLFELVGIHSLGLMSSTLTIVNSGGERSAFHGNASFFSVEVPPALGMAPRLADRPATPAATINLWHSAARGEATLIRLDEAVPLKFYWQDGLLVTSERILRAGGSRQEPVADDYLEIDLLHLTAICDRGAILATADAAAPYLLPINLECNHCIVVTQAEGPLVEQRGAPLDRMRSSLLVSGRSNFYPQTEVFWRLSDNGSVPQTEEMRFAEWSRHWPDEKIPQRLVLWNRDPKENPNSLSQHVCGDYLLRIHPSNPAATSGENHSPAGFDPALVPNFPGEALRAVPANSTLPGESANGGNSVSGLPDPASDD